MIEIIVAMTVMLTAIMMLASSVTAGFMATGLGRERQSASSLANHTVEQIRALPLDTVKNGLSSSDMGGDSRITACSSTYCFSGERIVLGQSSVVAPLNPHRQTNLSVGKTVYAISSYLTYYQDDTTTAAYRVTVIVTWNPVLKGTSGQTQAQTILHYPTGCLSTATRPFSGPCLAAFSTQGLVPAGSVHIAPHEGSVIPGISFDHADLWLPKSAADLRVEQITVAEGATQTSGASLAELGHDPVDVGLRSALSGANNDPDQPGALYSTASSPAQTTGTTSLTGNGNVLSVASTAAGGGDTGVASSTPAAATSVSPPRNCPNLTGFTNKTDGLPCSGSSSRQLSATSATLAPKVGTTNLGNATLASTSASSSPSTVVTERLTTGASPKCSNTSTEGCIRVQVTRGGESAQFGGLPSGLTSTSVPAGWNTNFGFVRLADYSDTATAESGIGTSAPTAAITGGDLKYYANGGYTNLVASQMSSDVTIPPLTIIDDAHQAVITLSGIIHKPATAISDPGACGSCTRTKADATTTPVRVDVRYTITSLGATIADLDMTLDPGALLAGASYASAPT